MTVLILDTCALIWLVDDIGSIGEDAKRAIGQNPDDLHVSAISALEIALLAAKGRITLPEESSKWYSDALRLHGISEIPITGEIASLSGKLPPVHKDPCDRIIIATAVIKRMSVVTADKVFMKYKGMDVIW